MAEPHWLDAPAPHEPEPGSQEAGLPLFSGKPILEERPSDWTPPPGKTPGQTYAAYSRATGDTGAMSGETEGLSPAMKQMIRRNLGSRLADMSVGEREKTAEHAMRYGPMGVLGPVSMAAGLPAVALGAAATGVGSQFMGDTPSQTADQVALNLLPTAAGKFVQAAPRIAAAAYGAGATMMPPATQSEAADSGAIRAQRRLEEQRQDAERENRKAAQAQQKRDADTFKGWLADPGNSKAMEGIDPGIVSRIKGAPDLKTAQDIFSGALKEKREAQQFQQWKQDNAGRIGTLAEGYQNRIATAQSLPDADAIFKEGAQARKEASMTLAERYPGPMTALEVALPFASAAIPAYNRWGQLNTMNRAAKSAEGQFTKNFGREAGELTQGGLNEADAAAQAIRSQQPEMRGMLGTGLHPGELAGGMVAPYLAGTLAPGIVDFTLGHMSSDPGGLDRANKAQENATSPGRILFNVGEGGAGSVAGNWGANQLRGAGNVLSRAAAAASNIERAPRNISPGSTLTQATMPGSVPPPLQVAPGSAPAPLPAAPEPAPGLPPSPRSFPPSRWLNPPPVEQMPGYKTGIWGAARNSNVRKVRRDFGLE